MFPYIGYVPCVSFCSICHERFYPPYGLSYKRLVETDSIDVCSWCNQSDGKLVKRKPIETTPHKCPINGILSTSTATNNILFSTLLAPGSSNNALFKKRKWASDRQSTYVANFFNIRTTSLENFFEYTFPKQSGEVGNPNPAIPYFDTMKTTQTSAKRIFEKSAVWNSVMFQKNKMSCQSEPRPRTTDEDKPNPLDLEKPENITDKKHTKFPAPKSPKQELEDPLCKSPQPEREEQLTRECLQTILDRIESFERKVDPLTEDTIVPPSENCQLSAVPQSKETDMDHHDLLATSVILTRREYAKTLENAGALYSALKDHSYCRKAVSLWKSKEALIRGRIVLETVEHILDQLIDISDNYSAISHNPNQDPTETSDNIANEKQMFKKVGQLRRKPLKRLCRKRNTWYRFYSRIKNTLSYRRIVRALQYSIEATLLKPLSPLSPDSHSFPDSLKPLQPNYVPDQSAIEPGQTTTKQDNIGNAVSRSILMPAAGTIGSTTIPSSVGAADHEYMLHKPLSTTTCSIFTVSDLILLAILASPLEMATWNAIINFIRSNFPKVTMIATWQKQIKTALYNDIQFYKKYICLQDGIYWGIDRKNEDELFKRLKTKIMKYFHEPELFGIKDTAILERLFNITNGANDDSSKIREILEELLCLIEVVSETDAFTVDVNTVPLNKVQLTTSKLAPQPAVLNHELPCTTQNVASEVSTCVYLEDEENPSADSMFRFLNNRPSSLNVLEKSCSPAAAAATADDWLDVLEPFGSRDLHAELTDLEGINLDGNMETQPESTQKQLHPRTIVRERTHYYVHSLFQKNTKHESDSRIITMYPAKKSLSQTEEIKSPVGSKPSNQIILSFGDMIVLALLNSPNEMATTENIQSFIRYHFPDACIDAEWKCKIVSTLIDTSPFQLTYHPGYRKFHWMLDKLKRASLIYNIREIVFSSSLQMKQKNYLTEMINGEINSRLPYFCHISSEEASSLKKTNPFSEFNYVHIVALAILNSPDEMSTTNMIHNFARYHCPEPKSGSSWKSVQSALECHRNRSFQEKYLPNSNELWWQIRPSCRESVIKDIRNVIIIQEKLGSVQKRDLDMLTSMLNGKVGLPLETMVEDTAYADVHGVIACYEICVLALLNSPQEVATYEKIYSFAKFHFPLYSTELHWRRRIKGAVNNHVGFEHKNHGWHFHPDYRDHLIRDVKFTISTNLFERKDTERLNRMVRGEVGMPIEGSIVLQGALVTKSQSINDKLANVVEHCNSPNKVISSMNEANILRKGNPPPSKRPKLSRGCKRAATFFED